ncbi:MAG TPA: FtsX-like permease family protein [Pseudolysinimonas sp.]|nr:FtsX-like permease family protein [Pseudolysinimonas sp.]
MSAAPSTVRTPLREHIPSVLVAALSAAFGVGLLQITGFMSAAIAGDDVTGSSNTAAVMLSIVAIVFIVIAVYVSAIITANTFATIVAGRARSIALLRLLGSSAGSQRRAIATEGLFVGLAGTVIGAIVGTAAAFGLGRLSIVVGIVPENSYGYWDPVLILPVVGVILTTWTASWVGSRRVLTVTPLQALGGSEELSREEVIRRPARNALALVAVILGGSFLALGILVGLVNPLGVLIGLVGGIVSFTGIVLAADRVMPPALRLVGRLLGSSAPARLAAENALRHPQRSSRATIGLVIGVTLLMTFGVAMATWQQIILAAQAAQPEVYQGIDQMLTAMVTIFSVLIGFSGIIAAVGLVNNLSLSVLQRTRELGLLRALGFSVQQLRRMILSESAQLTLTAVVLGVVLGGLYGWAGAQSLLGSMYGSPGLVLPAVPWVIFAVVVGGGALLTAIASWAPTRRATRVSPITALSVE